MSTTRKALDEHFRYEFDDEELSAMAKHAAGFRWQEGTSQYHLCAGAMHKLLKVWRDEPALSTPQMSEQEIERHLNVAIKMLTRSTKSATDAGYDMPRDWMEAAELRKELAGVALSALLAIRSHGLTSGGGEAKTVEITTDMTPEQIAQVTSDESMDLIRKQLDAPAPTPTGYAMSREQVMRIVEREWYPNIGAWMNQGRRIFPELRKLLESSPPSTREKELEEALRKVLPIAKRMQAACGSGRMISYDTEHDEVDSAMYELTINDAEQTLNTPSDEQ